MKQNLNIKKWRNKMTQETQVLKYLQEGNKLTQLQALRLFDSLRLSAIIFDLRRFHEIEMKMIEVPSGKRVGQYSYICKK
jgi:hypothetical protein